CKPSLPYMKEECFERGSSMASNTAGAVRQHQEEGSPA
ncbi:MAG: hypothetical protein AVDCRST_MAG96-305, partial [uncultured Segetibacter sp.]